MDLRVLFLFIPVAYGTYLFHELGHWLVGEWLGNDMAYSLNRVWVTSGRYLDDIHDVYVSAGGPAFTICQSLIFLFILERRRSIVLYPFVFFPMFTRLFSLVFGGLLGQDEARVSNLLGAGAYTIPVVVLVILTIPVLRASYVLRIDLEKNGYCSAMSTASQLIVIATYQMM